MRYSEAWRLVRAEERFHSDMRRIDRELDLILDGMTADMARMLAENPRYAAVVKRFFGRTLRGWEVACGSDRGLYKRALRFGWPRFFEAIAIARRLIY